jgi:hypothetical protein
VRDDDTRPPITVHRSWLATPEADAPARSRVRQIRTDLTGRERARLVSMFLFIIAINLAGWGIYVLCVMPHHFDYQGEGGVRGLGVGLGVAITAWFLGFRHAFDADHISCIDNTTRKLMADGKRPLASGFFFSFGHSTIIVAVGVGITIAARAVFGAAVNPNSAYETAGGAIGTLVSAGFVYLIAVLNASPATRQNRRPTAGAGPDVPVLRPVHEVHYPHLARSRACRTTPCWPCRCCSPVG